MRNLLFCFITLISFSTLAQQNENIASGIFDGEPYLAVNPTNTKNIIISWMHKTVSFESIRVRSSFDGGNSWSTPIDIPNTYSNAGDPTMAFNSSGTVYLAYIDHNDAANNGATPDSGGIYCLNSTDGGLTWSSKVKAMDVNDDSGHQPIDRPWLVCDKSNGAFAGALYITTKTVKGTAAPYHPYFVASLDGGNSWSPWKYVDSTGYLSSINSTFAAPTVAADGAFYGIYPSYEPAQSPLPRYLFAKSTDGGNSFTYGNSIVSIPASLNDSSKSGWQLISDPADAQHLVFLYLNGPNGDIDIYMTETFNGGSSWSSAARVNDDAVGNGKLQDMVWGSFDEDSDLVICWRDRRNAAGVGYAQAHEIYARVRWADSTNFSASFAVSDTLAQYSNILSQAGNDFMCQEIVNDTLYAAWGDTRTGFLNIWFNKIPLRASQNTTNIRQIASVEVPLLELYPNPSYGTINIKSDDVVLGITLFSQNGQELKQVNESIMDISDFAKGTYYVRVKTNKGFFSRKLIKE